MPKEAGNVSALVFTKDAGKLNDVINHLIDNHFKHYAYNDKDGGLFGCEVNIETKKVTKYNFDFKFTKTKNGKRIGSEKEQLAITENIGKYSYIGYRRTWGEFTSTLVVDKEEKMIKIDGKRKLLPLKLLKDLGFQLVKSTYIKDDPEPISWHSGMIFSETERKKYEAKKAKEEERKSKERIKSHHKASKKMVKSFMKSGKVPKLI